jgi:hypothetical protein
MCVKYGIARPVKGRLVIHSVYSSYDAAKNAANNGDVVGMFTRYFLAHKPGMMVRFVNNFFFLPED